MSNENTWCVIMAGGVGSRFWPMSRTAYPKQFLDFLGLGRTLLQQTYDRFVPICGKERILVVTNDRYAAIVREQLPDLADWQILEEPQRKNTAPCVAYANAVIGRHDPNAAIIVAPSDHLVLKEEAFHETIRTAVKQARSGDCLVTLGIVPSRPDTGYGYIQFQDGDGTMHPRVKKVKTFTEKPDHATAQRFIESGDFLWNAGIFIWTLKSIDAAFHRHLPEMQASFDRRSGSIGTAEERSAIQEVYAECASESIDYGIMEKTADAFTVMGDFGWSDLGTWGSLYTHLPKDAHGNAAIGSSVKLHECSGNVVHAHDDRLLVLQGLEDCIVVSTNDALLVCRKRDEQQIKQFVNELTAESGERYI
ncbi:MAG: NTP transferase domain-containing protein [Flavobacteriales bacterium]|nr:NTP transferase domain-containing protein [Flavobacteriales bacterium]